MRKSLITLLLYAATLASVSAAFPDISTWTRDYKGVRVVNGMVADSPHLWFDRGNNAQVGAVDLAEEVAAAQDRLGELTGSTFYSDTSMYTQLGTITTNTRCCYHSEWAIDNTVTQDWGGYSNFVLNAGYYSGTYTFAGRTYDGYGSWVGGAIDVYVGSSVYGTYVLLDCGPGGAQRTSYGWGSVPTAGWVLGAPFLGYYDDFSYSPAWSNATSTTFNYFPPWMGGPMGATITSPTYPTGGVSRVRKYCPHELRTYENYIALTADQSEITGIRVSLMESLFAGVSGYEWRGGGYLPVFQGTPCFIGPVNTSANYDGVTNFPRFTDRVGVQNGWQTNYIVWITNGWSDTHTYTNKTLTAFDNWNEYPPWVGDWVNDPEGSDNWYQVPPDTGVWVEVTGVLTNITYPTTTYWNANASIFVHTNELAWHYSALNRLRDSMHGASTFSNRWFFSSQTASTIADAWTFVHSRFTGGYDQGAGSTQPYPLFGAAYQQTWPAADMITASSSSYHDSGGWHTNYTVTVFLQTSEATVGNLYTNVAKKVEWYAHVSGPTNFCAYGTPDAVTNVWKLVDTQSGCTTQSITTVYNAWPTFPSASDAVVGQVKGYTLDALVPVIRWQQRACETDVFDERYP